MKKELNFRMGKGVISERKKALSKSAFRKLAKWVGMTDEEINTKKKALTPGPGPPRGRK